jgi:hypothetical protein
MVRIWNTGTEPCCTFRNICRTDPSLKEGIRIRRGTLPLTIVLVTLKVDKPDPDLGPP